MKNKTKGKKNQIKDLLATIECYQRPQSSKNNFKENNSNFNSNRHQLTWNQLSIHQLLINMSSTIRLTTIKLAFIIGYARKLIKGWSIDGKKINIYIDKNKLKINIFIHKPNPPSPSLLTLLGFLCV